MKQNDLLLQTQYLDINMRDKIKESLIAHAEGHIKKHSANVEIYLSNSIGIGERSDIIETIEKELEMIAKYDDQLHVLRKYF